MKLAIFGHCTIDTITVKGTQYEQAGGSAPYCGITARKFGFDVDLVTKFGSDFPKRYLDDNKIRCIDNAESNTSNTTKFDISVKGVDRTLHLVHKCDPLDHYNDANKDADGHIISPICGEMPTDIIPRIVSDSNFVLVDPQGFIRYQMPDNTVTLKNTSLDLSGVGAIKVNPEEAACLVGTTTTTTTGTASLDEAMCTLHKKGAKYVLMINNTEISLLAEDRIYSITLPNKRLHDTTGVGDIFCSAFCCTLLKEKDFLWALCFAGGAAQAALNSMNIGLDKIPRKGAIQTNASYFYNMIKFRSI